MNNVPKNQRPSLRLQSEIPCLPLTSDLPSPPLPSLLLSFSPPRLWTHYGRPGETDMPYRDLLCRLEGGGGGGHQEPLDLRPLCTKMGKHGGGRVRRHVSQQSAVRCQQLSNLLGFVASVAPRLRCVWFYSWFSPDDGESLTPFSGGFRFRRHGLPSPGDCG